MPSLLVVEDMAKDARAACQAAEAAGFASVELRENSTEAKKYLTDSLASGAAPSVILLDIDLGNESGFDVMRFWHTNPELRKIPLIVWTVLEGNYPEICRLFGVTAVVSKANGAPDLKQTFVSVISNLNGHSARS